MNFNLWSLVAGSKYLLIFVFLVILSIGLAIIGVQFSISALFIVDRSTFTCSVGELPLWWIVETFAFGFALLGFTYNVIFLIQKLILRGSEDATLRCASMGLEVLRIISILEILFFIVWTLFGAHWLKAYSSCITSRLYQMIMTWIVFDFFLFAVGFIIVVVVVAMAFLDNNDESEQTPFFKQRGNEYH